MDTNRHQCFTARGEETTDDTDLTDGRNEQLERTKLYP
jgi:hypothetical protein